MADTNNTTFVFRLQNEDNGQYDLQNTLKHWDESRMFGDKQINCIESSNKNSLNQPTSIPSPFARIALVKTAFNEVAEYGDKALKAYQKIVSDSLDVAEIFFTFEKWQTKFEIIKWDKNADLEKLKTGHRQLYKTLKTFLENDAETFNFDKMKGIYMLKYKSTGEIIGATSPCTLFLSSANNFKGIDIQLNNTHKAFNEIVPLNERSWDFQKYLYAWIKANNENRIVDGRAATSIFNEFGKYLESQKIFINRTEEIDVVIENAIEELNLNCKELRAPDVEVLGKTIYQNKIIGKDNLTAIDIFENRIMRLPYKIQNDSFFNGNLNESSKYSYLLPITDTFFKYYTINDLRKFIRINEVGSIVEVRLEIPNQRQEIKKVYKESESILILEKDFDCMLFPNIKFAKEEDSYYRFGVFLPFEQKDQIEKYIFSFYSGNKRVITEKPIIRNTNDAENPICVTYSLNQQNFNHIKINIENVNGVLIPKLQEKGNTEFFTFAVDFGTTNTHIEFKTNVDNNIKSFDIQKGEEQVCFLLGKNNLNEMVADIDFIPSIIGVNEIYKFPTRSALSLAKNKEESKKVLPFEQANIFIPFEKRLVPSYNRILTQLKWDSTEDEMTYFIDSLCFMLRNKVVLNNGILHETKLVWFYPLSMAGSRSKVISEKWKLAYTKYFLGRSTSSIDNLEEGVKEILNKNILKLPESVAPFLCYKDDSRYRDIINNLVSIDIGGGTTDIVLIKDGKKAEYVTSFRFAANSIFGLGDNISPVVFKYQSEIERIIENNDPQFKLRDILKSISGSSSGDLASFFFSLSDNEMLKNIDINFNSMLKRDNDQKLVFVLFYTAIIYHTAQIMKAKNLQLPRHITFSGNGSRIVNIIADKEVLAELSRCIFEKVYGQKYGNSGIDIIQNTKNPKEVTCKGGIKAADKDYIQTPFEPVVLLGIDETTFSNENDTYSSIKIEESVSKTNSQVKIFIDYLLYDLLNQKYTKGVVNETFVKTLNINQKTIQIAKDICAKEEDFNTFTRNGITRKIESITDTASTQIEETFFFYPIISLLNAISYKINRRD